MADRPETGLERTDRLLRELDGKVVHVIVLRDHAADEARMRRIAWEETQAQARYDRERSRARGGR